MDIDNKGNFNLIFEKMYNLIVLSLLVSLFSFLGLGIFGIGPSLEAAFYVKRREREAKEKKLLSDINYVNLFKDYYRANFLSSNLSFFLSLSPFILFVLLFLIIKNPLGQNFLLLFMAISFNLPFYKSFLASFYRMNKVQLFLLSLSFLSTKPLGALAITSIMILLFLFQKTINLILVIFFLPALIISLIFHVFYRDLRTSLNT